MERGFYQDPRTEESNSGILELATPNLCCKATRTLSFPWLLAHLAVLSLLALAICEQESGATSHLMIEDYNGDMMGMVNLLCVSTKRV